MSFVTLVLVFTIDPNCHPPNPRPHMRTIILTLRPVFFAACLFINQENLIKSSSVLGVRAQVMNISDQNQKTEID